MAKSKRPTSKLSWARVSQLFERALAQYEVSGGPGSTAGSPAPSDSDQQPRLTRNQIIETMRQHRFLERQVDIPAAYQKTSKVFRSPLAFDQVQRIVAVLTSGEPVVQIAPRSPSQSDLDNATKRERWLMAALRTMDSDREDVPVSWLAVDAQVADGLGVIKLSYHPSRYADDAGFPVRKDYEAPEGTEDIEQAYQQSVREFKQRARFPFSWRDVDPTNYFPIKGYDGERSIVLERHKVDVETIATQYGDEIYVDDGGNVRPKTEGGAPSLRPADDVLIGNNATLWEVWTHDEWSLWTEGMNSDQKVEGILLDGGKNPFNELPYFEFAGLVTSARDAGRRTLSVLYPSSSVYDALNTEITKGTNISHMFGYPNWKRTGGMIPGGEAADEIEERERIEAGVIYDMQLGGDMDVLAPPDLGRIWDTLVSFLMRMQDQVGLSSLTRGEGLGADASGYLFAQIASAAQGIYGPMQSSAERSYAGIIRSLQWCLENTIKTGVTVEVEGKKGATDWLELKPSDIDEYYRGKVRVKPAIPTNQLAQGNFAAAMNSAGLMSKKLGRTEYLDLEDPEAERQQILWERIQESPDYISAAAQELLFRRFGAREPQDMQSEIEAATNVALGPEDTGAEGTGAASGLPGPSVGGAGVGTGNIVRSTQPAP
jgi:hypothetical protein